MAISDKITYALVKAQGRHLIIALDRVEALKILGDIEVVATLPGESYANLLIQAPTSLTHATVTVSATTSRSSSHSMSPLTAELASYTLPPHTVKRITKRTALLSCYAQLMMRGFSLKYPVANHSWVNPFSAMA